MTEQLGPGARPRLWYVVTAPSPTLRSPAGPPRHTTQPWSPYSVPSASSAAESMSSQRARESVARDRPRHRIVQIRLQRVALAAHIRRHVPQRSRHVILPALPPGLHPGFELGQPALGSDGTILLPFRSLSATIGKPALLRSALADGSLKISDRFQRRMSDRFRENPDFMSGGC